MWETFAVAALTGTFTLGGVLLTSHLSGRATTQREDEARRNENRAEIRRLVAEFLVSGRAWLGHMWLTAMYMAAAVGEGQTKEKALQAWGEMEGTKEAVSQSESVGRTGVELLLLVSDDALREQISELLLIRGGGWTDDLDKADAKHADLERRFNAIEQRASELLRTDI